MPPETPGRTPTSRGTVLVGVGIAVLGIGWFTMSHLVMGTAIGDALGESLGVILGLLMVVSVIGAIRSGRGSADKPG